MIFAFPFFCAMNFKGSFVHKFLLIFLLCVFFVPKETEAKRPIYTHHFRNWVGATLKLKVHKNVGVVFDGQFRFSEFKLNNQHMVKAGVEIYANKYLSFVPIGYVHAWTFIHEGLIEKASFGEHRLFQQVVLTNSVNRLVFSNRVMFEQRWQQHKVKQGNGEYAHNGHTYKNRFRYKVSMNVPLNKSTLRSNAIFVSAYNELFVSFSKSVTYHLPDQNRAYIGMGYNFNHSGSFQLGYLNLLLVGKEGLHYEMGHTLFVGFNYSLDFTKKKAKNSIG